MATDFRASQVETSKIIASGGIAGTQVGLAIYSGSIASDRAGGVKSPYSTSMFSKVGKDVFLFVSGTATKTGPSNKREDITLFGGDIVVSGTMWAERMVVEVDEVVDGDFFVTGNMYVQPDANSTTSVAFRKADGTSVLTVNTQGSAGAPAVDINGNLILSGNIYGGASEGNLLIYSEGNIVLNADSNTTGAEEIVLKIATTDYFKITELSGITVNADRHPSANFVVNSDNDYGTIFVDSGEEAVALGAAMGSTPHWADFNKGTGTDVKILLSGTIGSRGGAIRGTTLAAGDLYVSGNLYVAGTSPGTAGSLDDAYDTPTGGGTKATGVGGVITVDGQPVQLQGGGGGTVLATTGTVEFVTNEGAGNRVGVGTLSPTDGTLHVRNGNAGSVTANTSYDDFVIESNASAGMSFLTPDANNAKIIWGSPSDNEYAFVRGAYSSGQSVLDIGTSQANGYIQFKAGNESEKARITKDGYLGIGTTNPQYALSVVGVVSASLGLSGSLTQLVDGRSYLAAGTNITITSASNGQVNISATAASLTVKEADGTPNVANVDTIVVSNGTLTDNGSGQVTLAIGGGTSLDLYNENGTPAASPVATGTPSTAIGDGSTASGNYSAIAGGKDNIAAGPVSFIGGGADNFINATANWTTIGGGDRNSIGSIANWGTVAGGLSNAAEGSTSFVGGGNSNSGSGTASVIGGGFQNVSSGEYSAILGSRENTVSGDYAIAIGSYLSAPVAKTIHIGGGTTEIANFTTVVSSSLFKVEGKAPTTAYKYGTDTIFFVSGAIGKRGKEGTSVFAGDLHVSGNFTTDGTGGGGTLDEAYDKGGTGVGGIITVDGQPVQLQGGSGVTVLATTGTVAFQTSVNNRVGVGTLPPTRGTFHIRNGTSGAGAVSPSELVIESADHMGMTLVAPDNKSASIQWAAPSDASFAQVYGHYDSGTPFLIIGTQNSSGYMRFRTGNGVDVVRITSDGKLGLGTTNPAGILDVFGNGSTDQIFMLSGSGGQASSDESTYADLNFFVSGTMGSRGKNIKGTSVFGGDIHVSGNLSLYNKSHITFDESGKERISTNGNSLLFEANDMIMFMSGAAGGTGADPNEANFKDTVFFVSGAIGSRGKNIKGTSLFGGDVLVSGSLQTVSTNQKTLFQVDCENDGIGLGDNASPAASVYIGSGLAYKMKGATSSFVASDSNLVYEIDATSGSITVDLPALSGIEGRIYVFILKATSGANPMILDPNGSEKIANSATATLSRNIEGTAVTIMAGSSFWVVLSDFVP